MKHLTILEDFNPEELIPNLYWGVLHGEDEDHGSIGLILCSYENGIPQIGDWSPAEPDGDDFDDTECDHLKSIDADGEPSIEQSEEWHACVDDAYDNFSDDYYSDQTKPDLMNHLYLIASTGDYDPYDPYKVSDYKNIGDVYKDMWHPNYPSMEEWINILKSDKDIKFILPIFNEENWPKPGTKSTKAIVDFLVTSFKNSAIIEYIPIINVLRNYIQIDKLLQGKGIDQLKMEKLTKAATLLKRK